MNRQGIKACREAEIRILAERGAMSPKSLYNRCVRYCLRYFRWGEEQANGMSHYTRWQWEAHEHEGELLKALEKRLDNELEPLGLEFEYPGLWPLVIDRESHEHVLWLHRY